MMLRTRRLFWKPTLTRLTPNGTPIGAKGLPSAAAPAMADDTPLWPETKEHRQRRERDASEQIGSGTESRIAKQIGHRHDTVTRAKNMVMRQTSIDEHFLLADLDFEQDAIVYGKSREEFEANVNKVKRLVIEFQRWEASETYYKWSTRIVQAFVIYVLYDIWEQHRLKTLLCTSLPNFQQFHEERLSSLATVRKQAVDVAVALFQRTPPNFSHSNGDKANAAAVKSHPMDTTNTEAEKRRLMTAVTGSATHELEPTSDPCFRAVRRVLLPQSGDYVSLVREQMLDYQKKKYNDLNFPKTAMDVDAIEH
jgi:hypothetical protein